MSRPASRLIFYIHYHILINRNGGENMKIERARLNNKAFIDGQNLKLGTTRVNPSWNIDL